jgi:o-succinylbenzoate synthase
MRLQGVELVRVTLALRKSLGTSAGVHRQRPVLYVRVVADEAEGWGECGALADGTSVDPALEAVQGALGDWGIERLFGASAARHGVLPDAATVARLFNADAVGQLSAAAVEMAVLDAELRRSATSLVERLGGSSGPVRSGAVVGIPGDRALATVLGQVEDLVERGFDRVRLKIEPGWDLAPVEAVRGSFPRLGLQVDANGSYQMGGDGLDDADRLAAFDTMGLACLEQPLPPADLSALGQLAGRLATPICLDESITSLRRLTDAIRAGAVAVACLKPARLGGLFAARRAGALCREAGIDAFVGGFFESGLGRSANAAVATLQGITWPGDLGDPGSYLVKDPCGYPDVHHGLVRPVSTPGVGNPPGREVLEAADTERTWFSFSP